MRCPVGAHRTPQSDPAERDRSAASLGGEQQKPLAHSAKTHPPQSLLSECRTDPAEPQKIAAERDRTGASTGSDQTHPLAHSAKAGPSPSFPASEGSVPRSPITTTHQSTTVIFPHGRQSPPIEGQAPNQPSGSGTGPERALERRHPDPRRATARKPSRPQRSLRAQDRSRGGPLEAPIPSASPGTRPPQYRSEHPGGMRRSFRTLRLCAIPGVSPRAGMRCPVGALRTPILSRASLRAKGRTCGAPKNRSGAGSDRSKHWKRSNPSPRAQRESRSFPELPCERRFGPAEPPKTAAERDRSDACIGSDQTLPLAHSAKTNPPPSLPACIGPVPRSPPFNSARFTTAVPLIPSPA